MTLTTKTTTQLIKTTQQEELDDKYHNNKPIPLRNYSWGYSG